jgi:hypothetical protein
LQAEYVKGGASPPHGPGEHIPGIRVRSRPALRAPQGVRGLRETGGPASRGKPKRAQTGGARIARPVHGRAAEASLPTPIQAAWGTSRPFPAKYRELRNLVPGNALERGKGEGRKAGTWKVAYSNAGASWIYRGKVCHPYPGI